MKVIGEPFSFNKKGEKEPKRRDVISIKTFRQMDIYAINKNECKI